VAGYYSATPQHNAAAPLADFCTTAYTRMGDGEFVASQACNHVDLAHGMLEASSHCLQELVSRGMAGANRRSW
jgi:hypothetical protein